MKRIVLFLLLVLFGHAASAQERVFEKNSFVVEAGANIGFYMWTASIGGFGHNPYIGVEYGVAQKGKSTFGIGMNLSGNSYNQHLDSPEQQVSIKTSDFRILPTFSWHYGFSSQMEAYSEVGVGLWLSNDKMEDGKKMHLYPDFDAAIGTRIKLYKGIGLFMQLGFPYSSAGLSYRF